MTRVTFGSVLQSALVLCGLLSSAVLPSVAAAAEKTKLILNWKPEPEFGGFYTAEMNGHYKKQGLEVDVMPGGAGTPAVQMVVAGQADFGIASADEVVISRSRGGDIVALFAVYQKNPQGIMVRADRGFKTLGDVYRSEGKLAIQQGLPYTAYLEKKYPKPKVQMVPYLGGIENFLNDKTYSQQCFITAEPLVAKLKKVETKTFLFADEGYNPYLAVMITRGDVLKKKPKLAKAMVEAVRNGWADYLEKPQATNKKMWELNKSMDEAIFNEGAEVQKPFIESAETKASGLGTMTEARWSELTKQLLDLKVIKKAPETKELFKNL